MTIYVDKIIVSFSDNDRCFWEDEISDIRYSELSDM